MEEIIMATHNPNKVKEVNQILTNYHIFSLSDIGYNLEIEETGSTLFENALLKVQAIFKATGKACLADDTGLEVSALYGAPGVYSARYSGLNATANQNMDKLLAELSGKNDRSACFRTVLAYMNNHGQYRFFEGCIEGSIASEAKGTGGFGYDPVFKPSGFDQTFAEMSSAQKNKISHRHRALREFQSYFSVMQSA